MQDSPRELCYVFLILKEIPPDECDAVRGDSTAFRSALDRKMQVYRILVYATLIGLSTSSLSSSGETGQAWMIVVHSVKNVEDWRGVFDEALSTRRSVGELNHRILQDAEDLTILTVVMEWDSVERATEFAQDPILANGMRAAGVLDPVHIWTCSANTAPAIAAASESCVELPVQLIYGLVVSEQSGR